VPEDKYIKAERKVNELRMNEIKQFELRNILLYLVITFAWTWLLWLPSVISPTGHSELLFSVLFIIGGYGPSVSAFLLTFITERKEGVKALWKRFWSVKIEIKWLLITILLFPALFVVSSVVIFLLQGIPPILPWVSQPWVIISYILTAFFAGGFSEEFGWRGYALDHLQGKASALISSLMTFASVLYTWVYNNTNRNILIAVIFHTTFNFMTFMIIIPHNGDLIYLIFFYTTIIIVVVFFKGKKLVRV
jgi:membrane protease YdiL (CAAX protease family)